jgi:Tfp pilus assembly protein PilV
MKTSHRFRGRGFALLEALIALLVAALALAAVIRLQGAITKGSGDALARSEALTFAQEAIEQLRMQAATRQGFEGLASAGWANVQDERSTNATFQRRVIVADTAGGVEARDVTVEVQWTDADGVQQAVVLSSTIGWDDPLGQSIAARPPTGSMIAPVGAAKRPPGPQKILGGNLNKDKLTKTKVDGGSTYLTDLDDNVLIYLDPLADGTPQFFTVIHGRIYFEKGMTLPTPSEVEVRLSSEGYCAQDPSKIEASPDNKYDFFEYWCYVGPGWYGNVGINVSGAVNGQAANPRICVGDPSFSQIQTMTSAHMRESATRTYRGFQARPDGKLLSTGVAGKSFYPRIEASGAPGDDPKLGWGDGAPLPQAFPQYYGAVADTSNHFNHHFLLTEWKRDCTAAMTAAVFNRNAGKYYCIDPHHVAAAPVCPDKWDNFPDPSGGGGNQCITEISGSVPPVQNGGQWDFVALPESPGQECSKASGNNAIYNCTLTAAEGSVVTLQATYTRQKVATTYGPLTVTATCKPQTGVDFQP